MATPLCFYHPNESCWHFLLNPIYQRLLVSMWVLDLVNLFFFFFFAHCNNPEDRYVKNRLILMKHLGFTCWNMIKFTILLHNGIISWWSLFACVLMGVPELPHTSKFIVCTRFIWNRATEYYINFNKLILKCATL